MPLIKTSLEEKWLIILALRVIAGLVWFGTVLRRLFTPNYSDFEQRITDMAQGAWYPEDFMDFAVDNWFFFFLIVLSLELITSLSLLSGTFARGGALVATLNGFAIGVAGIGLGIFDLIIPWTVAVITLILLLFTHPGQYKGLDEKLIEKNIPKWLKVLM